MEVLSSVEHPLIPPDVTLERKGVYFRGVTFFPKPSRNNKNPKRVLHNLNGRANNGELTAIMGPSGAGKTTLLNILSWRATTGVGGDVWYNGKPRVTKMKTDIAYVMQKDYFFDTLTVEETLLYAARLRYGGPNALQYSKNAVEEVLKYLSISKCRSTRIGNAFRPGISGGELKRVNIATELLVNPSIFFLDEPTSGLDSHTAVALVETLMHMARRYHKTIVASIHQPNSRAFASFDRLIMMAQGHIVYQGLIKDVHIYLECLGFRCPPLWNVADYIMELLNDDNSVMQLLGHYHRLVKLDSSGNYYMTLNNVDIKEMPALDCRHDSEEATSESSSGVPSTIVEHATATFNMGSEKPTPDAAYEKIDETIGGAYEENKEKHGKTSHMDDTHLALFESERPPPPSYLTRCMLLFSRAVLKDFKGTATTLDVVQSALVGLIVGMLWFQVFRELREEQITDYVGLFYFVAAFWGFIPAFSALTSFPTERVVIAKERASKLFPISAYLTAKSFSDMTVYLITPTIWLAIVFGLVGFPASRLVQAWLALILTVTASHSFGMMTSSFVDGFKEGSVIVSVFLLACMLSSGFYVNSESSPAWIVWLKWVSYQSYGTSLFIQVLMDSFPIACAPVSMFESCPELPITSDDILKLYTTALPLWANILWMLGFLFFCKAVTYAVLRYGKRLKLM